MNDKTRPGPWRHSSPAWLDEPVVPGLGPDALHGMDAEQIQHRAEAARQRQRDTRAELLARRVEDAAPTPRSAPQAAKRKPASGTTGSKAGKPAQRPSKPAPAAAQPRSGQSRYPCPRQAVRSPHSAAGGGRPGHLRGPGRAAGPPIRSEPDLPVLTRPPEGNTAMSTEMNTSDNTTMTTDQIRPEENTMAETAVVETTEETTLEPAEPIVPLPGGKLACRYCGVATSPRPPLHWVVVEEMGGSVTPQRRRPVARHEIPLTVCPDCAELTDRTAELLELHPGLTATRGPALAEPLAEGVVVAHRLLGLALPAATITDAELASLVRAYGHGTAATWERAVQNRPKDLNRAAASTPWSAVPVELLARLRAARAGLIAERLAETRPPHRLAPPALAPSQLDRGPAYPARVPVDGGCAWCGVASITLPAVEVHRLGGPAEAALARWRLILRDQFAGHLCPACADALDSEAAYGQTAVEGALIAHLGLGHRHLYLAGDITLDGVAPWSALHLRAHAAGRPAPAPSRSPWAHVGDLDGLRRDLATALGVAR